MADFTSIGESCGCDFGAAFGDEEWRGIESGGIAEVITVSRESASGSGGDSEERLGGETESFGNLESETAEEERVLEPLLESVMESLDAQGKYDLNILDAIVSVSESVESGTAQEEVTSGVLENILEEVNGIKETLVTMDEDRRMYQHGQDIAMRVVTWELAFICGGLVIYAFIGRLR